MEEDIIEIEVTILVSRICTETTEAVKEEMNTITTMEKECFDRRHGISSE